MDEPKPKRTRTRIIAIAVWAAAMAGAVAYMRCGNEPADKTGPPMKPPRCQIVINSKGIAVDGHEVNTPTAVELCQRAGGASVKVAADAKHSDVLQLQGALTAAHVDVLTHNAK